MVLVNLCSTVSETWISIEFLYVFFIWIFYIFFSSRFQPETKHLFAHDIPYTIPVFRGQYGLQSMLNVIDKNIFPLIEPNVEVSIFFYKKRLLHYIYASNSFSFNFVGYFGSDYNHDMILFDTKIFPFCFCCFTAMFKSTWW